MISLLLVEGLGSGACLPSSLIFLFLGKGRPMNSSLITHEFYGSMGFLLFGVYAGVFFCGENRSAI